MIIDFSQIKNNQTLVLVAPGSKNTTLPLLFFASGLAIKKTITIILENVANSIDVEKSILLLEKLGVNIQYECFGKVIIMGNKSHLINFIDSSLYSEIRYSILLLGLLLSFFDNIKLPVNTGGCKVSGVRKNDIHYDFFEKIGYKVIASDTYVLIKKDKEIKDIDYTLSIKSTSSSENILLYLILNYDKFNRILVHNFYGDRPDIQEVITFCNKCGLNIYYDQQTLSKIEDQKTMISSISFTIISDFDQILFYIFLGIVSKTIIIIENYYNSYFYKELALVEAKFGKIVDIDYSRNGGKMFINYKNIFKKDMDMSIKIVADAYPEIMSDSQPLLSLLSLYYPKVVIWDKRFLNRYNYAQYYNAFGFLTTIKKING